MMAGRKKGEVEGDAGQAERMEVSHDLGTWAVYGLHSLVLSSKGLGTIFVKFCSFGSLINITKQSEWSQTECESVNTTSGDDVRHI